MKTRELSECTFKPNVCARSARIVEDLEGKMRDSQAERWENYDNIIQILPVPLESERTLLKHQQLCHMS